MPEARIPLADGVILLATAPKSNSGELAINAAFDRVQTGGYGDVPDYLKDKANPAQRGLSREERYKYPHDYPNHWVGQRYLPAEIQGDIYYKYGENKIEQAAKAYWDRIKKI